MLYLPDEILVVDHHQAKAWHDRYDYAGNGFSTEGLPRDGDAEPFKPSDRIPPRGDHEPGEYARLVEQGEGELPARRPVRGRARPDVLRALRNRAVGDFAGG